MLTPVLILTIIVLSTVYIAGALAQPLESPEATEATPGESS